MPRAVPLPGQLAESLSVLPADVRALGETAIARGRSLLAAAPAPVHALVGAGDLAAERAVGQARRLARGSIEVCDRQATLARNRYADRYADWARRGERLVESWSTHTTGGPADPAGRKQAAGARTAAAPKATAKRSTATRAASKRTTAARTRSGR